MEARKSALAIMLDRKQPRIDSLTSWQDAYGRAIDLVDRPVNFHVFLILGHGEAVLALKHLGGITTQFTLPNDPAALNSKEIANSIVLGIRLAGLVPGEVRRSVLDRKEQIHQTRLLQGLETNREAVDWLINNDPYFLEPAVDRGELYAIIRHHGIRSLLYGMLDTPWTDQRRHLNLLERTRGLSTVMDTRKHWDAFGTKALEEAANGASYDQFVRALASLILEFAEGNLQPNWESEAKKLAELLVQP